MAEADGGSGRVRVDRSEGFGERLLGVLLDRAHEMPPQLIAPLIAEEVAIVGGREVSILLQDYEQLMLVPLRGRRLRVGEPQPIDASPAGTAFLRAAAVEVAQPDGVRMYLPLLDGSDQVGVLALTLDTVDDDDRRLLRRLAGLVADILVTKNGYTDEFFRARRLSPMSTAAEIQWSLLPPLTMSTPQVEVAGILEPAYQVAGDSFDYALNGDILHVAVIDAMGHGLDAAVMATVAIGAYRHSRHSGIALAETYAFMDTAIADHDVVQQLKGPTTLPVGFGGEQPRISEQLLQRGDRVLFFTDGLVEEHLAGGEQFGEEQLIEIVTRVGRAEVGVRSMVRALSHTLKRERGGATSDDATLFLVEWRGGSADHLATASWDDGRSIPPGAAGSSRDQDPIA
ncbi:PP2C family protein-serine/threonine phosphatase [Kitasatospora sp. NPDC057223]|uniref:PP2C family protein-serine/threonine phosphatase n=1 Tax=Kitasatospora sp. NPDC057223 TaxID=3346055 RepID=UPI00362D43C8